MCGRLTQCVQSVTDRGAGMAKAERGCALPFLLPCAFLPRAGSRDGSSFLGKSEPKTKRSATLIVTAGRPARQMRGGSAVAKSSCTLRRALRAHIDIFLPSFDLFRLLYEFSALPPLLAGTLFEHSVAISKFRPAFRDYFAANAFRSDQLSSVGLAD